MIEYDDSDAVTSVAGAIKYSGLAITIDVLWPSAVDAAL